MRRCFSVGAPPRGITVLGLLLLIIGIGVAIVLLLRYY
jgi:hypothetical protein